MAELYFKQLLAGRDFGKENPICQQMANFIYLIGDVETKECLVVDPAWAVEDVVRCAEADDMKVVGALVTHYHPDHIGGDLLGFPVEGLPKLLELAPGKIHVNREEAHGVQVVTGVSESDLEKHDGGDKVKVGGVEIELLHTPGHTPGSQCFRLKDELVSGDTLFLQGCGRVDLPGGDADEMYRTLTQRLSTLPGDLVLYPGHAYSGDKAPLEEVRRTNDYLQVPDLETWRRFMG